MAFPMAAPIAAIGPLNPIETIINGFNTNPYFIGLMMILMNLGGRHLAGGLTPEQDKIFQHPWVRRALLFVVIFVATRNLFTALWLSIGLVLVIGYLTNETSALYLFGKPKRTLASTSSAAAPAPAPAAAPGLTGEEQEILRRLQEKAQKAEAEKVASQQEEQVEEITLVQAYPLVMKQF